LRDALDGRDVSHTIMTIFAGGDGGRSSDHPLAVPSGRMRRGIDPRAALAVRGALRRLAPDILVAHGGEPLLYAALTKPSATRLVYYRIGRLAPRASRFPHRPLYRWAGRRCALVAGVAPELLDEAHTVLSVPRHRLRLVPNGRDPAAFAGVPRDTDNGSTRLLWVGHLVGGKGPERFLDVVSALRRGGREVDALMVGDGPLESALEDRARAVGVDLLGRRDDVPSQMAAADVVCFTSSGEGEGQPGVLIEAGMAARPCVTTRVCGASSVVDHARTGFVVDVQDRDAFVDSVARLVDDPVLRARMGKAARERCVAEFTLEQSVDRWRNVLAELLPS
jgi:glycosyltransferase involved in cell wall biosynthesis